MFIAGFGITALLIALDTPITHGIPDEVQPAVRLALWLSPIALSLLLLAKRLRSGERIAWMALGFGALTPWVLFFGLFMLPHGMEYLERTAFDAQRWRGAAYTPEKGLNEERLRLIDDLIESGRLDGMARADVTALLGPDDSAEGTGWGRGYFTQWDLVYWLGTARGPIPIDSEWLVICFENDVVSEYRLVMD